MSAPVVYRGVGQAVKDSESIFHTTVLTASGTAYSGVPGKKVRSYPQSAGAEAVLATAMQARNNARAVVVGSTQFFSDEAFAARAADASQSGDVASGNRALAAAMTRWAFQETGVLRVVSVSHSKADGSSPETQLAHETRKDLPKTLYPDPEIARDTLVYRIRDDVVYRLKVQQLGESGEWEAFQADDMQLEFVMLDPYERTTMQAGDDGVFTAVFKVPDVYGIFKFRVVYRRPGLTTLFRSTQVSVRPYRHNEYERFIESAFPYYTSAFSMMAGVFVFSFAFLYHRD